MKDLQYYMSLKYPFTLEQDDNNYFIQFPDLPDCKSWRKHRVLQLLSQFSFKIFYKPIQ